MRITVAAPAKINLWLRVGPLRPTGFHDLDTLFCTLDLSDDVVLRGGEPGRGIRLGVRPGPPLDRLPALGPVKQNLVMRAARAFQERAGEPADLRVALLKRIPPGAGLGGGSSDAGAVLRGLRQMHPDRIEDAELLELALSLGSDVPFFLSGHAMARGRGRGERLTALPPLPSRPVVVVLPTFPISTAEAYRWLDQFRQNSTDDGAASRPEPVAADHHPLTWEEVETLAHNDFEPPVFARHAPLGRIRDRLLDSGAGIALLSGTGSTVFGVFADRNCALAAAEKVGREEKSLRIVVAATRPR